MNIRVSCSVCYTGSWLCQFLYFGDCTSTVFAKTYKHINLPIVLNREKTLFTVCGRRKIYMQKRVDFIFRHSPYKPETWVGFIVRDSPFKLETCLHDVWVFGLGTCPAIASASILCSSNFCYYYPLDDSLNCTCTSIKTAHGKLRFPYPATPEVELLDINLTKDSSLLLYAIHTLSTGGF